LHLFQQVHTRRAGAHGCRTIRWADLFGYPHPEWPEDLKAEVLSVGFTEADMTDRNVVKAPTGDGGRVSAASHRIRRCEPASKR
jgi:hypothetical protein